VSGPEAEANAEVESLANVSIIVEPRTLAFREGNQKENYTVRFERKIASDKKYSGHQ
jgi:hypothetical protein